MMKKPSGLCCLFMVLLTVYTDTSYSFSLPRPFHSLSLTMIKRIGLNMCKAFIAVYWGNYLESHGYDLTSQQEEARRSGACSIPWPVLVQGEVPIAPGTVPELLRERIEALKNGRYRWPACKPILLTGPAGIGKTQLTRYLAQQSQCPFMYTSAAGFMSSKESSGVETAAKLFKRSRIRSELSSWVLRFRQLLAFVCRRPIPRKKPAILLIDEFDAISKPSGNTLLEGDRNLEVERDKTLARLWWEISHNEYTKDYLEAPRCPPADYIEHVNVMPRVLVNTLKKKIRGNKRSQQVLEGASEDDETLAVEVELAQAKRNSPFFWEFLLSKRKAETLVVATTNSRVEELDPEVENWFDVIAIRPFDQEHRRAILEFHGRNKHFHEPGIIERLSQRSEGYSADKLDSILNDAAMLAADRDDNGVITQADIDQTLADLA